MTGKTNDNINNNNNNNYIGVAKGCTDLIKVPADYVDVSSERLQVVIAFLGAKVACAEDVLDLPRDQQLLELGRQGVASMRDVQVT